MRRTLRLSVRLAAAGAAALLLAPAAARAIVPPPEPGPEQFARPELYLPDLDEPLPDVRARLRNARAWSDFLRLPGGGEARVWVDRRSGTPSNVLAAFPLLPGPGKGNRVTLAELGQRLGRTVRGVEPEIAGAAVADFVRRHRAVFGLDPADLGPARATRASEELWQVVIPQQVRGIPVRDARLTATVRRGNLVLIGTDAWGKVRVSTTPSLSAEEALRRGFDHAGGRLPQDRLWQEPHLEILPVAPPEERAAGSFAGAVGEGYAHRLAWVFGFERAGEIPSWEVIVDAHDGELLAFRDRNHYLTRQITGGVYPFSNTDQCPSGERCGAFAEGFPMPFADTGLAAPNQFTNSAGRVGGAGNGAVSTRLRGRFVELADGCGALSQSAADGALDLGGAGGEHDCTTPAGASGGNTAAARTAFYELNRMIEIARGWLPGNGFLQGALRANVNLERLVFGDQSVTSCNAVYRSADESVSFLRSSGLCRNTGELAAVLDHEWGHALDDHDANPGFSNTSEAYADIAAAYRLQRSCIGYGFFDQLDQGCGRTGDGTGANANLATKPGVAHCARDCSGVREIDFARHAGANHPPDTPAGFVCKSCVGASFNVDGPCGRDPHCESAPITQAAWDFATRDLRAAPFAMSSDTAFLTASKLFYQGSGGVGKWYSCSCLTGSSRGCRASSGYMQWLAADDDNGSLADGTPHMTALFAAFNRHGIACADPAPRNGGCAGGPTARPAAAVFPGEGENVVVWSAVPRASRYRVFRTEGGNGCDLGKALIAEVAGTSHRDRDLADGRAYSYVVQAVGSSDACFGPASPCASATPGERKFALSCAGPSPMRAARGGRTEENPCLVTSEPDFAAPVSFACFGLPPGAFCTFAPLTVNPPAGGGASTAVRVSVGTQVPAGSYGFALVAHSGGATVPLPLQLRVDHFGFACAPEDLAVAAGASAGASCILTSPGFPAGVTFICAGAPPGVSCVYSPPGSNPPPNLPVSIGLEVRAAADAFPGTHEIAATAREGEFAQAATRLRVTVPPSGSDFQVACDAEDLFLFPGQTANVPCTVTSLAGFSDPVAWSCQEEVAGVTCSAAPTTVTPPAGGSAAATLTLRVAAQKPPGQHIVRAVGRSGALERSFEVHFSVDSLEP